jgi:hypothetical protein
MLDLLILHLAAQDVEQANNFWSHWVNQSKDVATETNVPLIKELNPQALVFRLTDHLSLVVINRKVLGGVDHSEVFHALDYSVDGILDVKDERRRPVLCDDVVDVTLGCGADYHVAVLKRHVDDALSEV